MGFELDEPNDNIEYNKAVDNFSVLYRKQINAHLIILVGQSIIYKGNREPFVSLILRDEKNDRFIVLRLSTFRKVIKWMFSKKLTDKPRRLTVFENMFREPTPYEIREGLKVDKKVIRREQLIKSIADIKEKIESSDLISNRLIKKIREIRI